MSEQTTQYLMKLAIDFGSTNTVMAWRIYEKQEDGGLKISEQFSAVEPIRRIPTTMALREDNPGNESVPDDLFGTDAMEAFNHSSLPVVLRNNFKQFLYTEEPGSPQHEEGVRLTKLFFEYLRRQYVVGALNPLPQYARSQLEVVLYLTLPVRKTPYHRRLMESIAVSAGFTKENGVDRISSELDEAECVVRYATDQSRPGMSGIVSKAADPEGALLLFIDVGGSTMDMTLKRMRLSPDGCVRMDELSSWPDQDVTYPLGGCLIDEAIKNYLIHNHFAIPDFLEKNWREGKAKEAIRRLKENYNRTLSEGGTIEKLGSQVLEQMFDYEGGEMPPVSYANGQKINGTYYVDVIAKEYIQNMYRAMAELFDAKFQRPMEGRPLARPEDVDALFLAGAGSRLFFIPQVLLSPPCGLEKVRQNLDMLFADWKDPSLCCVLGALADQEGVVSSKFSKYNYIIQYQVYTHPSILSEKFREDPMLPDPGQPTYQVNGQAVPCRCVLDSSIPLAEKFGELPIRKNVSAKTSYTDDGNEATLRVLLLRVDDSGGIQAVGTPFVYIIGQTISQMLAKLLKTLTTAYPAAVAGFAAQGLDAVAGLFKGDGKNNRFLERKVYEWWDKIINPVRDSELDLSLGAELSEELELTVDVNVTSKYLQNGSSKFELKL